MTDYYVMVDGAQIDGFTAESTDGYNIEDFIDAHIEDIERLPDYPNVTAWIEDEFGNWYQEGNLEDYISLTD